MASADQITEGAGSSLVQIGHDGGRLYAEWKIPGMIDLFRCAWVHRTSSVEAGAERPFRVLPDNCADFIVSSSGECWLVGPATGVALPQHAAGTVLRGLRIQPAALNLITNTDGYELTDGHAGFDDVLSSSTARVLADALWHDAVDHRMLHQLWTDLNPDSRITEGIRALTTQVHRTVDEIAEDCALSARQFRRIVRQVSGLTPKTLQRVSRLHHVLDVARTNPDASLAMLAVEAGFTDQSHFAHDVRKLADLSPLELLRGHA